MTLIAKDDCFARPYSLEWNSMSASGDWSLHPKSIPLARTDYTPTPRFTADVARLHSVVSRMTANASFTEVLQELVEFATSIIRCDSCFIYILEADELVLRASRNSHPEAVDRLKLKLGQGITGWVAKHRQPVVVSENAACDPRFQLFNELPEDRVEAFLWRAWRKRTPSLPSAWKFAS
jgi:transcriptional regulator with GAF, ATPase, and Fis domain